MRIGLEGVVERLPGDAESPGEDGLRDTPHRTSCRGGLDLIRGEASGAAPVDAAGLGGLDALALPVPDQGALELGDGAQDLQLEDGQRVGTGAAWKVSPSLRNRTATPVLVRWVTSRSRSTTQRASRSMEETTTVSSSRTWASSAVRAGRSVLAPEAWSVNQRSGSPARASRMAAGCRSGFWSVDGDADVAEDLSGHV